METGYEMPPAFLPGPLSGQPRDVPTTSPLTYRKTSQGEWVVFGPVADMRLGLVWVRKRDGSIKDESVERLGRPFDVAGVPHCYGYLRQRTPDLDRVCDDCGRIGHRWCGECGACDRCCPGCC